MIKSITLPVVFYTNEHVDFPENITIYLSEKDIKKIKNHLQYAKDNDVSISMEICVEDEAFEKSGFVPSVELLKIYPGGYIYYYAQSKWSGGDQIETKGFKLDDLINADN